MGESVEIKVARVEENIKHIQTDVGDVKKSVNSLGGNLHKLVEALTANAQQSNESRVQISEIKQDISILFEKHDRLNSLVWKMAILIALLSSGVTVGMKEALKMFGV